MAYEKHTWQSNELVTAEKLNHIEQGIAGVITAPLVVNIPTGQWSGSGSDYYINVTASNVTADSILVPTYDRTSDSQLNGPVWCVPAAGSFTIHTSAIPTGTVTIMVQFIGTLGEAQYQVLADVYSKSQTYSKGETDTAIAQSTATQSINTGITGVTAYKAGNVVTLIIQMGTTSEATSAGWFYLGILPVSLKPLISINFLGYDNRYDHPDSERSFQISSAGNLYVALANGESCQPRAIVTYIVA